MHFEILGEPVGEGRARAFRIGAGVRMHSPKRSSEWRALAAQQMAAERSGCIAGPAWVRIDAIGKRPQGLRGEGRVRRCVKPDIDNVVKATLDAMVTAGVLGDDKQVVQLVASKWTAAPGELPRVVIDIGCLL